jgi:predicted Zn-dependent peptidase
MLHAMLGITIPSLNHPDWGIYTILRTLLAEGMSSRLYTALRGNDGLCYSIEGDLDEFRHACVVTIYTAMQPGNVLKVLEKICQVFASLRAGEFSPEDLEKARRQVIGRLMIESDDVQSHARALSLSTFLTGKPLGMAEQIAQLKRVNIEQLRQVAYEAMPPENLYGGFVGNLDAQTWQRCQDIVGSWH